MSGAINKVKDALHLNKDHTTTTGTTGTTGTTTHGTAPHGTTHTTGTTGTTTHGTTPHGTTTHGTTEGVAGPHSSRMANAADPRIDSDLDNPKHPGAANTSHTAAGTGVGHTGGVGHSGTTGTGVGHSTTSGYTGTGTGVAGTGHSNTTTAGPHSSNVSNKADPRVDSDLDGSRNMGAASTSTTAGHTSGTGHYGGTHAGNTTGSHTGTTGGISHSTNAGPHNSNAANQLDPRVDSDLDGSGNRHGASTGGALGASGSYATPGSGTAQNTAGPHNSDMLNKADPRVDSDVNGSKTIGGNKTHA